MVPFDSIDQALGKIASLYGSKRAREAALAADPGLVNVLALEQAFAELPAHMDWLDSASLFHRLKMLSTQLYFDFFAPFLDAIPASAHVLDAGCGIGRFTLPLAERFAHVTAFDPCRASLACCAQRVKASQHKNIDLHWADFHWLDDLQPETYDVVFAVELLCYTANATEALRRLVRMAKNGAMFFISVEGRPGALAVQGAPGPGALLAALEGGPLNIPGDRYVTYYDRQALSVLLNRGNLEQVALAGSHYFGEGPFWQSIDDDRLDEAAYVEAIVQAEKALRVDPAYADWARVFAAVGKKR